MNHKDLAVAKIILMFHDIKKKGNSLFDVEWQRFTKTVNVLNFIIGPTISHKIIFTFDDGYSSQLLAARYLSLYFKIKSIIFVPTSFIGRNGYLSKSQIARNTNKFIIFGSHGHKHIHLGDLSSYEKNDIYKSSKILEKIILKKITFFSFPHGSYSTKTLQFLNEKEFKFFFTSKRASNRRYNGNNLFNRFVVTRNTSIILILLGYTGILDNAQNLKYLIRNIANVFKKA